MAEVNTDIYRQQNPLGQLSNILGVMNTAQQNQLLQTANQQRQLELQQGYASGLYNTIAPLVNVPGITQAQVRAAAANYARQVGMPAQAHANFDAMLSGPDWQTNLKNLAVRSIGPEGILRRENVVGPTGETTSYPATSLIGGGLPTGVPMTTGPSVAKMQGELNEVGNVQEQLAPWLQMRKYAHSLPEGGLGPGSPGRQHLEEGLFALSPQIAKLAGVDVKKIKDYASFAKYAAQAANTVGGNGTDLKMMQTITGNPNPNVNDPAVKDLIDFGIGVIRMGAVSKLEASRAHPAAPIGSNGAGYIGKKAEVASKLDPNAFMYDLMTPEQRAELATKLKGKQRENFNYSIHIGQRNNLLTLPGQ